MSAAELDPLASAMLLAASAAGDPGLKTASLDAPLRARVDAVQRDLAPLDRRARMTALVTASAPHIGHADAPARARAIVATLTTRELGAAWMREAGAPRVGFRASASLRATIAATEDDAWRA